MAKAGVDREEFLLQLKKGTSERGRYSSLRHEGRRVGKESGSLPIMTARAFHGDVEAEIWLSQECRAWTAAGTTTFHVEQMGLPIIVQLGATGRRISEVVEHPALAGLALNIDRMQTVAGGVTIVCREPWPDRVP